MADLEDWFRAESELMRRVPVEIKEADSQITVRAEVPGFAANEINVSVEPQQLVIRRQVGENDGRSEGADLALRDPLEPVLPRAEAARRVDPAKTTAVLKDGVLELGLQKSPR